MNKELTPLERLERTKHHFNPKDISNKELFNEDYYLTKEEFDLLKEVLK